MSKETYQILLIDLDRLAKSDSDSIMSNRSAEQANAIISTIYRNSKNKVRLFANDLDGSISEVSDANENYFKCLEDFLLRPDTELHVIIEKLPEQPSKLFSFLNQRSTHHLKSSKKKVDVRLMSEGFKEAITKLRPQHFGSEELLHFITGDDRMFRIEYDSITHKANFSFKNEQITRLLNQTFDTHFSECRSL